jgi:hypothetical protein
MFRGLASTEMLILLSIGARADLFPAPAEILIFNPMNDGLLVLQWRQRGSAQCGGVRAE